MNSYSIVITTFDQRFESFLIPLTKAIKTIRPTIEIIVMINGPAKATFNNDYRRNVLSLLSTQENCFPTIFPNFQSLAKLWNRGVLTSTSDRVLVLNDDLLLDMKTQPSFFDALETILGSYPNSFKINGSFSHFIINKQELIEVGFFDERLLGIGEEDGDFSWRYHEKYKVDFESIELPGIENIQSNLADAGYTKGVGHYSKFNREFIKNEKYQEVLIGGYKGMFDKRSKKKLGDEKQYPYEEFYLKNRHKL